MEINETLNVESRHILNEHQSKKSKKFIINDDYGSSKIRKSTGINHTYSIHNINPNFIIKHRTGTTHANTVN
ncbi:hypothetical protein GCM10007112_11550 [Vulcanisaeta souniana JCM 11219]|uniref:Uncharacterized protein n=1 Tax=Vulcanisaeta souniana JCM 11219 TaxID=1293586 RepID=A0A830E754_9CREN|nr:hypothetical protein GCM10007112_11550 [Vulcanisaeta souniana JCM 11219]